MTSETKDIKQTRPLPAPNSDFYQTFDVLNESQQAVVKRVRTFMETQVEPIINRYWLAGEFPFELIAGIRDLHIAGIAIEGYGCPGGGSLLANATRPSPSVDGPGTTIARRAALGAQGYLALHS